MSVRYCVACERKVTPKRYIGVLSIIFAILTIGWSLLLIPFYSKKCPICRGSKWKSKGQLEREEYLKSKGTIKNCLHEWGEVYLEFNDYPKENNHCRKCTICGIVMKEGIPVI